MTFSRLAVAGLVICLSSSVLSAAEISAAAKEQAAEILKNSEIEGGLIVHIGSGDGQLTAALRANERFQVHGLDTDTTAIGNAREFIRELGLYGDVSVDRFGGNRLPYIDNLINLVVAADFGDVSMDEVMRVLAPEGVVYFQRNGIWTKQVKPRPDNIDEWTHFMHDAGGNAVAHDDVVGPPRHLQWLGSPRWSRHHDRMASMSALVSSGGRVFYIMDEGSRISIQMPPRWTLVARDAFNGTVLWKRPLVDWHNHLWPLKSGPTQLARRLVAIGPRVYVTPGFRAPLISLDAATGEEIQTFENTDGTEELIVNDGLVFAVINKGESELSSYAPAYGVVGDQARVREEWAWNEMPRQIAAFEAESGRELWRKDTVVSPLTLSSDPERVFMHDGEKVVALDRYSGNEVWHSAPAGRVERMTFNFGPKLVIKDNIVLFAGGDRNMQAFNAASGEVIWEAPHARGGYQSPEDLLVAGGLVWSAPTTSGRDSGVFTGRDLATGVVKKEFPPDVETYWFHHRCYIAKATDKFLMPSRTGIEFVDQQKESWDINHWVRGGCLYGVMPCNGLVYAPPHNCACYPEAKLYGMNVLAPASPSRRVVAMISDEDRLEKGPAWNIPYAAPAIKDYDWPTYRHDLGRSGFTRQSIPSSIDVAWKADIGGRLSSLTAADGKLFVADVDEHTVLALDAKTGKTEWSYTTGGRVDSPPTYHEGTVIFGSTDGSVYCVVASDGPMNGKLKWRFHAAPEDTRLTAFEQLESVWPVHGSVLVREGAAYFVAGRSNYLDGGLHLFKIDATTGEKLAHQIIDDKDPQNNNGPLQDRLQTLQMPVGLADILSSDDEHLYMRSQLFDFDGNRKSLGPHSGQAEVQGSVQTGEGVHLFAPMGFLDDTWFHRSYWVFGRSFAGGHNGYYQAGRYAPSGRILVADDKNVYGFGRNEKYLRWTTVLEHELFAASKVPPPAPSPQVARRGGSTMVQFESTKSLDPTNKAIAVSAWIKTERPDGVIVARGGPAEGYALVLRGGEPAFVVRSNSEVSRIQARKSVANEWAHVVGMLTEDKELFLYLNGELVARGKSKGLITKDPAQALEIGADDGGAVGNYQSPLGFNGVIDEVKIYHGTLSEAEVKAHFENSREATAANAKLVLSCNFDTGNAADSSGEGNHGKQVGAQYTMEGKMGRAMTFASRGSVANRGGSYVEHEWAETVPLLVRSMVLADKTLFIMGPPDLVDEEETFARIMAKDEEVNAQLAEQDRALDGEMGGKLFAVSATTGETLAEYETDSLPVWDSLIAANGRLYYATIDGDIVCYAGK